MCGRFVLTGGTRLLRKFKEDFGVEVEAPDDLERLLPEGDVTFLPFHNVPAIYVDREGRIKVGEMYWQLIQSWNRRFKSDYTQFNTRAESLHRRYNRELLERQRCIFPVNSFFETRKKGGVTFTPKECYQFSLDGQEIIPLGGIYSIWTNPDDRTEHRLSCSIITVEPNPLVAEVHDRMPFIVPHDAVALWLDGDLRDFDTLMELIGPHEGAGMQRTKEGGDSGQVRLGI